MFGRKADGSEQPSPMELVRLAIPRRLYTQSHMDYVLEVILEVFARRERMRGMKITWQAPALRHFSAKFAYLD
jgi:tryptophanase